MAALLGDGAGMVARREVGRTGGRGRPLALPLFDPLFSVLGPQAANYKLTGEVKVRTGSRSTNAAPRNVYETKDGHWVCLSASTQGMAERVLVKIGRPELVKDPRFATNIERVKNGIELDAIIGGFINARHLAGNPNIFDHAGVAIGPDYHTSQLAGHDYVHERDSAEQDKPHVMRNHANDPHPQPGARARICGALHLTTQTGGVSEALMARGASASSASSRS